MEPRKPRLPPGWYPQGREEVLALFAQWIRPPYPAPTPGMRAAIAPHAGWYFSGPLAAQAMASLAQAQTVVVIGGHLPPGYPCLAAPEGAYETPLGLLGRDEALFEALKARVAFEDDRAADNTVEVLLPLVAAAQPQAKVLWLRAPADPKALDLGAALGAASKEAGREVVCLGSTDLTHYGPDYGFTPAGSGPEAQAWVREVSDKSFIDATLALDGPGLLVAGKRGAACSAGAAAAALAFAQALGPVKAHLLGHGTSLDRRAAASFVGYCALGLG